MQKPRLGIGRVVVVNLRATPGAWASRTMLAALCSLVWAGVASAQPPAKPPAVSPAASASLEQFTAKMKASIFKVKAKSLSRDVFATGTGFAVDSDGFAFTNFHVIQGAMDAEAEFPATKQTSRLELVAADPNIDLALVRIVDKSFRVAARPLTLASSPPIEGLTVWAIGYPKGLGFSMSRGVVNGVRQYTELPVSLRKQLKFTESSEWVQTDATINAGNSGGPLVDDLGTVIGINTWIWLEGNNLFFALGAKHLQPLYDQRNGAVLGFEAAAAAFGTVHTTAFAFPTLDISPRFDIQGAFRPTLADLRRYFLCDSCAGRGSVTKQIQTGWRQVPLGREPVYQQQTRPCERCAQTGFGDATPYSGGVRRLAECVVQANRDADYESKLPLIANRLREVLSSAPGQPTSKANGYATRMFAQPKGRIGDVVWYFGKVKSDLDIPSIGRQRTVEIGGENLRIVASELQFSDVVVDNAAFGFGYYAGHMRLKDSTIVPVIQGGMLLRLR